MAARAEEQYRRFASAWRVRPAQKRDAGAATGERLSGAEAPDARQADIPVTSSRASTTSRPRRAIHGRQPGSGTAQIVRMRARTISARPFGRHATMSHRLTRGSACR